MQVITLLDGVALSVNDTSATVNPQIRYHREGLYQFTLTSGSGTVILQGKLHPDAAWEDIQSLSGSDAVTVALFPIMQLKCTVSSSLIGSAWLQHS
jgi:hypothetical protein